MLIENIQHKPESSKQKITPLSPALTGHLKVDLHQASEEFIKKFEPFTWYSTLTFRYETHPEAADRAFKRWIVHINQHLYGRRYREHRKYITWIRASEKQTRGAIHFHVLIGSPELHKLLRGEAEREAFAEAWVTDCFKKPIPKRFKAEPNRFDRLADYSKYDKKVDSIINGWAKIDEYDSRGRAASYLSKYIFKGGEVDYFIAPEQWHLLSDHSSMLGIQFVN